MESDTSVTGAGRKARLAHDRLCHAATPDEVDSIVAEVLAEHGIDLAGATYRVAATAIRRCLDDEAPCPWVRRPVDSSEQSTVEALYECLSDAAVVRYELYVDRDREAGERSTAPTVRRIADRLGGDGGTPEAAVARQAVDV